MSDNSQTVQVQTQKKTSPFKEVKEFEKDLRDFANKHKTMLSEHSKRISDYFEMSCYSMIVRFYEHKGYHATVENEKTGRFRFKCSPSGLLENFSYMKVTKNDLSFNIYHNASVQSAHDVMVFTTPDIVVANAKEPSTTTDYYKTKRKFSYLPNNEMITFCEAKHHTPFAELMVNFIGVVNELKPWCLQQHPDEETDSEHLAPSLMMSGCLNKPTIRIANSLQNRYYINMLSDLFLEPYRTTFSKEGVRNMATLTKKRSIEYEDE